MVDVDSDDAADSSAVEVDPGMARAGAAAAARRRELDISQRSLAADGIINAGALISFEKGRSWPRERTRAKLEEVLQWAPGTIARIRRGGPSHPTSLPNPSPAGDEVSLIAQAVEAAVHSLGGTDRRAAADRRSGLHPEGHGDPRRPAAARSGRRARGADRSAHAAAAEGAEHRAAADRRPDPARGDGADGDARSALVCRAAAGQPHHRRDGAGGGSCPRM